MSILDNKDPKVVALARHLDVSEESINEERDNTYSSDDARGEYLVLTNSEANEAWEESLNSYLNDMLDDRKTVPAWCAQYFNREAWKRDARHDGRGHSLSPYDGHEHEVKVDDEVIFIYRIN